MMHVLLELDENRSYFKTNASNSVPCKHRISKATRSSSVLSVNLLWQTSLSELHWPIDGLFLSVNLLWWTVAAKSCIG